MVSLTAPVASPEVALDAVELPAAEPGELSLVVAVLFGVALVVLEPDDVGAAELPELL